LLKILATFNHPLEAHVAESYLNDEGIETMLEDEFIIGAFDALSNAIGGVKLLVHEDDYEKGLELLTSSEMIK
jgi:hypothetical protein